MSNRSTFDELHLNILELRNINEYPKDNVLAILLQQTAKTLTQPFAQFYLNQRGGNEHGRNQSERL